MRIKRGIARVKIMQRKRQRVQTEKKIHRLSLERNKLLKEAEESALLAAHMEEKRLAEMKRAKALASLKAEKAKAKSGTITARGTIKALSNITRSILQGKPQKRRKRK